MLRAALVIIDKKAANTEQVTGIVLAVGADTLTINPEVDTVCGIATDSLLVDLVDGAEFLTVVITDTASEITPGGELAFDQTVGMNGSCKTGGYETDTVIIVDDQRD